MRKRSYTRNVGVLVDDETYKRLIAITDKHEITLSKYIRGLIEQKISEETEDAK
jgi:predicted DNA-binding protein